MKKLTFILGMLAIVAVLGCSDPVGPNVPLVQLDELPMSFSCDFISPAFRYECGNDASAAADAWDENTSLGWDCDIYRNPAGEWIVQCYF